MHESNSIGNAHHVHNIHDAAGPAGAEDQHGGHGSSDDPVAIDCDSCDVRGLECGDCVISVLLGAPPSFLDDEEQRALEVLADSGLVPPLRLVTSQESAVAPAGDATAGEPTARGAIRGRISTSARRDAYQARDTG